MIIQNIVQNGNTGASLGIHTKFASFFENTINGKRKRRFYLQTVARSLLPDERVRNCLRLHLPNVDHVAVLYSPERLRARYGNLTVCGSLWNCPVCASKISEGRRQELILATTEAKNRGYTTFLATFTFQHTREDKLTDLRAYLSKAFRRMKSGRWWKEFSLEYKILGSISATEITWGYANGWHPHKHVIFFLDGEYSNLDLAMIENKLGLYFSKILGKMDRYSSPIHGVMVTGGNDSVGAYVTKWGIEDEVSKAVVKKGRGGFSPFEILEYAGQDHDWAKAKFVEYAHAMKGCKQLVWSRGLRDLLGLNCNEVVDQDLAEDVQVEDIVLARIDLDEWRLILAHEYLSLRAIILEVGNFGDAAQLRAVIDDYLYPPDSEYESFI